MTIRIIKNTPLQEMPKTCNNCIYSENIIAFGSETICTCSEINRVCKHSDVGRAKDCPLVKSKLNKKKGSGK